MLSIAMKANSWWRFSSNSLFRLRLHIASFACWQTSRVDKYVISLDRVALSRPFLVCHCLSKKHEKQFDDPHRSGKESHYQSIPARLIWQFGFTGWALAFHTQCSYRHESASTIPAKIVLRTGKATSSLSAEMVQKIFRQAFHFAAPIVIHSKW